MNGSNFSIREAVSSDIASMRAIERRATQIYRTIGYDFCADGPIRDVEEHERVQAAGMALFAVSIDGLAAGFAMYEPLDGEIHLVEIDVDPAFQNKGLARRMIAIGEGWTQDKGFGGITLTTYRDVPWNAPFYRRIGFTEFEPESWRKGLLETVEREAAWGFALRPRIVMRKQLK